jgi:endonuclease I
MGFLVWKKLKRLLNLYRMKNKFFLILFLNILSSICFSQGSESFSNIPASSGSYAAQNWTGDNALPWSASDARTDQVITGRAITLRVGSVICNNIPNGIASLTFKHQQFFTGTGPILQVYINSLLIGTVNPTTTAATATFSNINITGNFNLEIRQVTSSLRVAIDDIVWTGNNNNPPCQEPASQPSGLSLTSTLTSVSGSFTFATPPPNAYLVVRSTSSTLSASPVDGISYANGQALGGGTVVVATSSNSFTDINLGPSTPYYYFVFSLNDQDCTAGANYLQTTPLIANTVTQNIPACVTPATRPTALVLTAANNFIGGSFTAATSANRYLVVINTSNSLGSIPANGTEYAPGDNIGSGTVVSYSTSTSFTATNLTVNSTYYFFIFAANADCTGEPLYNTTPLSGSTTTTNTSSGIPTGFYDAAAGLTCQPLKTALKIISSNNFNSLSYTPGLWIAYQYTDIKANTPSYIWDIYTDDNNTAVPETYNFIYTTNQCGGTTGGEGSCYNREHTTPQSWFNNASPMVSDVMHILPTDSYVNGKRGNFPYGEVTNATYTSIDNQSKLGSGNNFGYTSTVFEPINAFKGDLARINLYMATRYEDEIISQNWASNTEAAVAYLSTTDQPVAASRRLQIFDNWYLQTMFKWLNQDPVSQKEIDRNNAIYYQTGQNNRNPFVDHPEYAALIWQCTGVVPVTITDFIGAKQKETVLLKWYATYETNFKKFEIERSSDAIKFTKTGEITGGNLANYSFEDKGLPASNILYYRLKMIDIDGSYRYSTSIAIRLNNRFSNAFIYPNPTKDLLHIKLLDAIANNTNLIITDLTGRLIQHQQLLKGQNSIDLNVQSMESGRYLIHLNDQKSVINQSFVIIK